MKSQKLLWAAILLAGCASVLPSEVTHEVFVQSYTNGFLQTREIAIWSIRSHTDNEGNFWPTGLTLNARVSLHHDGTQQRFLMLRKDDISFDKDTIVYDQVRRRQLQLQQQCTTTAFVQDGRALELPVHSITVRALTNTDQMPEQPTDYNPDPIESMVGRNTSDGFVISTLLQVRVDKEIWQTFASARALTYELCGEPHMASEAELEGLQKAIAQGNLPTQGTPHARPAH